MEPISFSFSRREGGAPSGFELGDLTIVGNKGTATSTGKRPDQGMMVYPSLVDLMDGVRSLLGQPSRKKFTFVGADSSFSVAFEKRGPHGIVVSHSSRPLATVAPDVLTRSLLREADRFLGEHPLTIGDSVFRDIQDSRQALAAAYRALTGDGDA